MKKKFRVNSFFSGIGGFDIAFEKNGFSTQLLCEINPFCNQILDRHWPNVTRFQDINNIETGDIPQAEVWCGGFPCQDISLARGASKRLGLNGKRSGLFYKFAELISRSLPEVVVLENVGGLFNSNHGRDFGVIIKTMTSLGYAVAWRLLNSRYFGVPQSRTRVYFCCWRENPSKALHVMFDKEGAPKPINERLDFITQDGNEDEFPKVPKISYCLAASSGRHTGTDWSRTYVVCREGVRRLSPIESERLQGFPDNWTMPKAQEETEDNIDTLRYTAIGNAVSVPVVGWVAKRIKKELETNDATTLSFEEELQQYKDFHKKECTSSSLSYMDFTDANQSYKWEKGGLAWHNKYISASVYPTPLKIKRTTLLPLIEKEQQKEIYYLTPNAAEGIIRRVDHQSRTLFAPLRIALEALKAQNVK